MSVGTQTRKTRIFGTDNRIFRVGFGVVSAHLPGVRYVDRRGRMWDVTLISVFDLYG